MELPVFIFFGRRCSESLRVLSALSGAFEWTMRCVPSPKTINVKTRSYIATTPRYYACLSKTPVVCQDFWPASVSSLPAANKCFVPNMHSNICVSVAVFGEY